MDMPAPKLRAKILRNCLPGIFHRSIGARLQFIILVMLTGMGVIIAVSTYSFYRIEVPRTKLEHLHEQHDVLQELRFTLPESMVTLDQMLYGQKDELIGTLIAFNEKILSQFNTFQTDADKHRLIQDAYLGKEY